MLTAQPCVVFGDGSASRDFCFVDNVVQANLLAACTPQGGMKHDVFNVACGARMTLRELFEAIQQGVADQQPSARGATLQAAFARPGDIPHSFASIDRAREDLGYEPSHDVARGLSATIAWHALRVGRAARMHGAGTNHPHTEAKSS
jgi:UDP-N-acetylglucosamine 4-epimerase